VIAESIPVLDHGFVRLDDAMASDLSVVNAARVSFARRKEEMDAADEGLIRFLMRDRHGTPFEHNAFRFHIRCPIFVAREWFRHRIGCLTGDTEITFVNCNGSTGPHMRRTVDELWSLWTEGERDGHAPTNAQRDEILRLAAEGDSQAGGNGRRDGRWRVRRMRVRVLDESTGEFSSGRIADIIDKGVQPVYRLTLADGKQLTVTENHRLLTTEGWLRMRDAVGLTGAGRGTEMTKPCLLMTNGVPVYQDRREGCGARGGKLHAHHAVPVWLDPSRARDLDNLVSVCEVCHRRIHRTAETERAFAERFGVSTGVADVAIVPRRKGFRLTAHPVAVVACEYVGLRQTYDLAIDGPSHNFVANGIVVHNSFNEFSMRYAKATDEFYVPDAGDVRSQVGKPGAYTFEPVEPELAEETREALRAVYEQAYATYTDLVDRGVAREVARSVLPVGAYTEFYWTVNARALMNFVSLRAAEAAQREIRRYADAVEGLFAQQMPVTYDAFVANDRTAP
jgi:thymidylate synthase (FAD)